MRHYHGHSSSTIEHSDYDPLTKRLVIRFKSGGSYSYDNVPPAVHEQFIKAKSAGKFFHASIRDKYKTVKL